MADLRPFRAYRPRPDIASKVASAPYDVIDTAEARALAAGNPFSFLHVTRPEIDLPEGVDEHSDEVYAQARVSLEALIADGVLVPDAEPRIYVYALRMGTHRQVGVVALASVAEYDRGLIKKHENTRADKEDDRTLHIDELGAHDEPVFLTYRASPAIDARIADVTRRLPIYDFTTTDGVQHELWVMDREGSLAVANAFFKPGPAMGYYGRIAAGVAVDLHIGGNGVTDAVGVDFGA